MKIDNEETLRARENYAFTTSLSGILRSGTLGITELPGIIKRAISRKPWEQLYVVPTNRVVSFPSMKAWVEAMHPEGLGTTVEVIKALIKDDDEAMSLFIQETEPLKQTKGNPTGVNQHSKKEENLSYKNSLDERSNTHRGGTSQGYLLSRIARDRPDILPEIGKGKTYPSARAAAKAIGVPLPVQITLAKDVKVTAKALKGHYSVADIESLIDELKKDGG